MKKTAVAHANIALVKYWGKRDAVRNLPAVGSISLTLQELFTRTSVEFRKDLSTDRLMLNGTPGEKGALQRVSQFLDLIRTAANIKLPAQISSENNFPTGAGLASSASGFAALALAASAAAGLRFSPRELSAYARQGSGSAARSIFGGFVEMHLGKTADGSSDVAEHICDAAFWPLEMLILITDSTAKKIGSTDGMNLTAETYPYYDRWVDTAPADIAAMRMAIANRDFQQLGEISEFSCLKMHGLAMSANPGLLYWNGHTVELIHEIRRLRHNGYPAYFTIDAGPQIKIICAPGSAQRIRAALSGFPGIEQIFSSTLGPDAYLTEE